VLTSAPLNVSVGADVSIGASALIKSLVEQAHEDGDTTQPERGLAPHTHVPLTSLQGPAARLGLFPAGAGGQGRRVGCRGRGRSMVGGSRAPGKNNASAGPPQRQGGTPGHRGSPRVGPAPACRLGRSRCGPRSSWTAPPAPEGTDVPSMPSLPEGTDSVSLPPRCQKVPVFVSLPPRRTKVRTSHHCPPGARRYRFPLPCHTTMRRRACFQGTGCLLCRVPWLRCNVLYYAGNRTCHSYMHCQHWQYI